MALAVSGFALSATASAQYRRYSTEGTPSTRERAKHLDLHMENIENNARSERIVGGVLLLAAGVGLGLEAVAESKSDNVQTQKNGPILCGIGSALSLLGGILVLSLPTDSEKLPQRFRSLPIGAEEENRIKVYRGETELSHFAIHSRSVRYWRGGILSAGGIASSALYFSSNDKPNRSILLYGGLLLLGGGFYELFSESTAESQYREYREYTAYKRDVFSSLDFDVIATNTGAGLALRGSFW